MRGHGQLGLLDRLRTFADLADDGDADRRPYLDFFPGVDAGASWLLHSGGPAYYYNGNVSLTLQGLLLDIVAVHTSLGHLTRVETLADCIATAGTFFAQENIGDDDPVPEWDDGTLWDAAGVTWDHSQLIELYVHLAGGADPNDETVVPLLGLHFGTRGEVHPHLGPEKLTNGGFESLTGWSEQASPGWDDGATEWDDGTLWDSSPTSAQDTSLFTGRGSTASLKLVSGGVAAGYVSRYQDKATVAGARYRLAGYYRTDEAFSANLEARLLVGNTAGTTVLYEDGRDGDASGYAALAPTYGEWRRFLFDFLAPDTTTRIELRLAAPTAGAGQLNFDGVTLKRIYRFVFYDPRLSAESLPEVEVGSQSIFFAGKKDGQGSFSLINADGVLEPLFAQLLLHGKPATISVGGALSDGQEVYRDDWRTQWPGIAQKPVASDIAITFEADDARRSLHVELPPRVHNLADEPDLALNDEGYPRVIVFAREAITMRARRVALTGFGYGVYELVDGETSLAGILTDDNFPDVHVYPNEELAEKEERGFKLLRELQETVFDPETFFSFAAATGLVTINDDLRSYVLERDGTDAKHRRRFDFNIGGGTLTAEPLDFFVSDVYRWSGANHTAGSLQTRMREASGAADITVTYDHTTHKFTVAKAAGTLNLLPSSGPNSHLRGWELLGFDVSTDKSGALSYTSDTATFDTPESDHVLRFRTYGLVDDAAGTITGTPNVLVCTHADVAKYVLHVYLGVPLSLIDEPSFAAGAALEPTGLVGVVLGERMSSRDFLARLEAGAIADLVVDADGVWIWRPYAAGSTPVQDFFDRDYLSWELWQDPEAVFARSRIEYGQSPALGTTKKFEHVHDAGIPTKHGEDRDKPLDVLTWIDGSVEGESAAQQLAQRKAKLAAANPYFARFASRGKTVDLLQGDIIRLTRSRAMYPGGSLDAVRFRVLDTRRHPLSGIGTVVAVEDVEFLS